MRRMYSENQLLKAVETESNENGLKVFENIVDQDGNARFIEGDITTQTVEGVEYLYNKWSLSGTHLMIVLAFKDTNRATSTNSVYVGTFNLPEWIFNKLVPIGTSSRLDLKTMRYFTISGAGISDYGTYIQKSTSNKLQIFCDLKNYSGDAYYRISFDFIVDNE